MIAGGGNPTGSFTGNASAFEIIGNHIYALNNVETGAQNTETTIFKSETGNFYSVGQLRFSINSSSGDDIQFYVYFNGVQVWGEYATSGTAEGEMWPLDLIIPAYTEVKLTATNVASGTGRQIFIDYAGRIYRG